MLHIFDTTDEVLKGLADYFVRAADEAIAANGRFSVALSGGSSPKKLYELLASSTYNTKVDWPRVFFFFGDERNVPDTDKDSNALMAKIALFDPLKIHQTQIFKVNTDLPPADAAKAYTDGINQFFNHQQVVFDLVLLGLGDNSHTASLFPHTPILHDDSAGVKDVWLEDQQVYRISFTAPLINQAYKIAFLVYGDGKAEAVRHVLKDATDIDEYPAQLIRKDVDWFLDKAAAAKVV
ncbi:6-phosphogluconolactonase [Mucilaginibacter sp. PPCGB 2223]|uniref:6-phosphogluconolactonase n=1 Tax=Mucilaginibacter sp. PPCGB 2223 TaxID=1886027 RepID=UPI00082490B5|nr:6-phosphogluconolactonase [Mucilaginibacter sp. PPCGB 2223]OCX53653.1 6-phosphogluconolactonase [Mucilaginibacter sp. PPCGB 2223]